MEQDIKPGADVDADGARLSVEGIDDSQHGTERSRGDTCLALCGRVVKDSGACGRRETSYELVFATQNAPLS